MCFGIISFYLFMNSSEVFHISNRNATQFGINTLCFDTAQLWNRFYFELLNQETNDTKSKIRIL